MRMGKISKIKQDNPRFSLFSFLLGSSGAVRILGISLGFLESIRDS